MDRSLIMPGTVRISLRLLIGGYLLAVLLAPFYHWPALPGGSLLVTALLLGIAIAGLMVFIAVRTYQGRNWGRWVMLVFLTAATPGLIRDIGPVFGASPVMGSLRAIVFMVQVVAVLLLFTPQANEWYRRMRPG